MTSFCVQEVNFHNSKTWDSNERERIRKDSAASRGITKELHLSR